MRRLSESGSATVELLVLTPVLFGFFVLALIFGRVAHAREVVAEALRKRADLDGGVGLHRGSLATEYGRQIADLCQRDGIWMSC
jgi:hypothetical protein